MSHLVFIGDSLTQWCDWERRFAKHTVTNLGISGETVEGLLARRDWIRSRIEDPDFVFLMTGINNIANERHDFIVPYREIVRNLTTWYKQARVVVQSILPVQMSWISNNLIRSTNQRIEQVARELNADYLDLYRSFVDEDGNPKQGYLSGDGIHLAAGGYDVWSAAIEDFLKKHPRTYRSAGNKPTAG